MTRHSAAESSQPAWNDIGVIALVPDDWGPQWQNRHQVFSRLAAYFHIAWVNPAPGWRISPLGRGSSALRVGCALVVVRNWFCTSGGLNSPAPSRIFNTTSASIISMMSTLFR